MPSTTHADAFYSIVEGISMKDARHSDEPYKKHLDSSESVVETLKSKMSLLPEVKGYFAAFEPDYFKEKGH